MSPFPNVEKAKRALISAERFVIVLQAVQWWVGAGDLVNMFDAQI